MKILICDDEEKYVKVLKAHVEEYMKNNFVKAEYCITTSSTEIFEQNSSFDLVFLDIQMPEISGITLAKELKRRNGKVILFFITAFEEYQDEAMDLHIFRFFDKPFDVSRLYSSLDKAMEYIDESYIDIFLTITGEQKRILIDDIFYVKNENRKTIVVTNNNQYNIKSSFSEITNKIPNTFFYLVHKSFFINLHYVTRYNYSELYINKDIRIPIASRKQADFHKYWFDYLRRR